MPTTVPAPHSMRRTARAALRVLLVDETASDRRWICQQLIDAADRTLQIWDAEEADDAVSIAQRHGIDVALVDYPRPASDGCDLLSEITATGEGTVVILLTGPGNPIVPAEALRRGASGYMSKSELTGRSLMELIDRARFQRQQHDRHHATASGLPLRELAAHLHHVERCLEDHES